MRFHHSTRRGRNRLSQQPINQRSSSTSTSRWSQLGYCRETNIHFHRRLPVEPPSPLPAAAAADAVQLTLQTSGVNLSSTSEQQLLLLSRQGSLTNSTIAQLSHRRSLRERRQQQQQQVSNQINTLVAVNQDLTIANHHSNSPTSNVQQLLGNNNGNNNDNELKLQTLSLSDSSSQQQQSTIINHESPQLDMDSVRQKLVAQVEKHPFWSSRAAKRMHLTGIQHRRVLIYELTSFCERRDLEWRYESYRGGLGASSSAVPYRRVDLTAEATPTRAPAGWARSASAAGSNSTPSSLESPISTCETRSRSAVRRCSSQSGNNNNATGTLTTPATPTFEPLSSIERPTPSADFVWSIEPLSSETTSAFTNNKPVVPFTGRAHSMELPGSSFVKRCHGCQGRGRLKCTSCYGVGYEVCLSCSGKGSIRSALASSGGGGGGASSRAGRGYYSAIDSASAANPRNSPFANGYDQSEVSESAASSTSLSGRLRGQGEPGGITSGGLSSGAASSLWATSESCHYCHGAGQKRCWVCAGKSYNHCLGCLGAGQLRCYLQLNITWLNHRDEIVLNNSDNIIPRDRLRLSTGRALLEESSDAPLSPLSRERIDGATAAQHQSHQQQQHRHQHQHHHHHHHYHRLPEAAQLQQVSRRLIEKHLESYRSEERILKQRQRVTQVDCHLVSYEWKQQRGHFVIYGDERKVYIAKYPFKSFCNIT